MTSGGSTDKWLATAGIGGGIAGIIALLGSPGGIDWGLLIVVAAVCAAFIAGLVLIDRKLVRTGRLSQTSFIVVFLVVVLALCVGAWAVGAGYLG